MSFKVNIHKDFIEEMDKLPSLIKAEVIRKLEMIITGGHTYIPPYEIKYGYGNSFTIYANRNSADNKFNNCAILMGFYKDGQYYIDELRRIQNYICQTTGETPSKYSRFHIYETKQRPHDIDKSAYMSINGEWVHSIVTGPFLKKSFDDPKERSHIATSILMELENRFHFNLSAIDFYVKHRELACSNRSYARILSNDEPSSKLFDRNFANANKTFDLSAFLDEYQPKKRELLIVNWLDETDEWCGVQRELIAIVGFYLKEIFPEMILTIIDIVIRDKEGFEPYYQDFLKAFAEIDNLGPKPKPFTTLKAVKFGYDETVVDFSKNNKLIFNFNLFYGCENYAFGNDYNEKAVCNDIYRQNLRGIIHEMFRITGLCSDYATTPFKDFRSFDSKEADDFQFLLEECCVVLTVHGQNDETFKAAVFACCNAILRGWPNVVVIRVEGEDGVVHISDHTETYSEIKDIFDTSDLNVGTLICGIQEKYDLHQMHAGHNKFQHPFRIKLEKPLFIRT